MDGIKEYLGMMHELPDFTQINRVSLCVCLSVCIQLGDLVIMECIIQGWIQTFEKGGTESGKLIW